MSIKTSVVTAVAITTLGVLVATMSLTNGLTMPAAYAFSSGDKFCFSGTSSGGGGVGTCTAGLAKCKKVESEFIAEGATITEPCHKAR